MAERFQETVNIQPQSVQTGFAQANLSLADRLDAFKNQMAQRAEVAAVTRGEAKAKAVELKKEAGITQAPEYKQAKFFGTVEAESYNKALRNAYLASLDTDNRENISRIQLENPDDVMAFDEAANGYIKGVLDSVDPSIKQEVGIELDSYASTARNNVYAAQISREKKEAFAAINANIDSAFNAATSAAYNGDNDSAANNLLRAMASVDGALDAGFITEDDAATQKREMEREVAEQTKRYAINTILESDPENGIALAKTEVDEWAKKTPKGWQPDEWQTFIDSVRSDLSYEERKANAIAAEVSDTWERQLFSQLLDGTLTEKDLLEIPFDDESKRMEWANYIRSRSAAAMSAEQAEINAQRAERNQLYTDEVRARSKLETAEETRIDELYSTGDLTKEIIDDADVSASTKRTYRNLIEKQASVLEKEAAALKKALAEREIINHLGEYDEGELEGFLSEGLTADEIYQWKQRNKQEKSNPTYKSDNIYKTGLADLLNAKKNYLFIGGRTAKNLKQDNENTQLYLNALDQYEKMSSKEGADFMKILNDIKAPYIEYATKNWIQKLGQEPPGAITLAPEYDRTMSDEEFLKNRPKK